MTKEQEEELKELRRRTQILRDQIQRMETELQDTELEIRSLYSRKKGRWIGFAFFFVLFALSFASAVSYFKMQEIAMEDMGTVLNAVTFSVSTTALVFLFLLIGFFGILTIKYGARTIMELGSSTGAEKMARRYGRTNYPSAIRTCKQRQTDQQKECIRIKMEKKDADRRLKELEILETPWYEL